MQKEGLKVVTLNYIGTTAEWQQTNPRLQESVWAFEQTTDGRLLAKIGDGQNRWDTLKYFDIDNIAGLEDLIMQRIALETQRSVAKEQELDAEDLRLWDAVNSLLPEGVENLPQQFADVYAAIDAEASEREQEDEDIRQTIQTKEEGLNSRIDTTNGILTDLQRDFNAWIGRGGYLDAYDFGTATPSQQDLTDYALSQIPTLTDHEQIWNATKIVNAFNNNLWILTNTQDTEPPIFEWNDQGNGEITPFEANIAGIIKGADSSDPPEYVRPVLLSGGKGMIDLQAIKDMLFDEEHPVGDVYLKLPFAPSPIDKHWRGHWVKWNDRASGYRLRPNPVPLSPPMYDTYNPGSNYPIGTHIYYEGYIYRNTAAVNSAPEDFNPASWIPTLHFYNDVYYSEYTEEENYPIGSHVFYEEVLYRNTAAISSAPEIFNTASWTPITNIYEGFAVYTQGHGYALGTLVMYNDPTNGWRVYRARSNLTNVPATLATGNWDSIGYIHEDCAVYTQGHGYAQGTFVMYNHPTNGWSLYRARANITNVPTVLATGNWDLVTLHDGYPVYTQGHNYISGSLVMYNDPTKGWLLYLANSNLSNVPAILAAGNWTNRQDIINDITYLPGTRYLRGSVVTYHLQGSNWRYYKAKKNFVAQEQLDPVLWDQIKEGEIIDRKDLQEWADPDFEIGQQITGGEYDGYYVEEIFVYGGKYISFPGGNRFESDGEVQEDAIRNIKGRSSTMLNNTSYGTFSGAFNDSTTGTSGCKTGPSTKMKNTSLMFNASLVVPVANEVQVINFAIDAFRRVG